MLSVIETCPKGIGTRPRIDISGQRFGMLVVLYFSHMSQSGQSMWMCRCDCGIEKPMQIGNAKFRGSSSCGCRRTEMLSNGMMRRTHGQHDTTEYHVYCSMRQRCTNKLNAAYSDYGGRGITICERWLESFENFFEDMGKRPSGTSLDRIDNNLGYSPDNCRWASKDQQANNTRANRMIEFCGETMTMAQWASRRNVPIQTLFNRLLLGWTVERALTTPSRKHLRELKAVNS